MKTTFYYYTIKLKALITSLLLIALITSGCANNQQQIAYYLLDSHQDYITGFAKKEDLETILVEDIELAKYLDQPGLIIEENNQIHIAKFNLWGERLKDAAKRLIVNDLTTSLNEVYFITPFKLSNDFKPAINIKISIQRLNSSIGENPQVVFAGEYWLYASGFSDEAISRRFSFSKTQTEVGYIHAVRIKRELFNQLAEQITQDINGHSFAAY